MRKNHEISAPKFSMYILLLLSAMMPLRTISQDSLAEQLKQKILSLNIKGLTVTDIQLVQQGNYMPKSAVKPFADLPAFCMVAITLKPTAQSDIKIELWLPSHNWNGRLLGTGNGGGANGAVGKPEVWADFGYRATHVMTVVAKAILQLYYGRAQHHAYFAGCSKRLRTC